MVAKSKHGFTLIELLVSVSILLVLSAVLIPVVGMVMRTTKETTTGQRGLEIMRALSAYQQQTGSTVRALQDKLELGGVLNFVTYEKALNQVRKDGGGEPLSKADTDKGHAGGQNGRFFPPYFYVVGEGGGKWYRYVTYLGDGRKTKGSSAVLTAMRKVKEVLPPASGPIPKSWYTEAWPYSWPLTDWNDSSEPGIIPPILRWPWGSNGLNLVGNHVQSDVDATEVVDYLTARVIGATNYHPREGDLEWGRSPNRIKVLNGWGVHGTLADMNERIETATLEDIVDPHAAYYSTRSDGSSAVVKGNEKPPFDVGLMSPLKTIEFLQAADVLPPGEEGKQVYRSDRTPGKPWNDAWGNPLIVSYALFQPERFDINLVVTNRGTITEVYPNGFIRDWWLDKSQNAFGHNRAIYLVVGAALETLEPDARWAGYPGPWHEDDDAIVLRNIWRQIRRVTKAVEWNEHSWDEESRPENWNIKRVRSEGRYRGLITEPKVIK